MDPDEPRRGRGPRRAPVNRPGRSPGPARRTAPGRVGGPRRTNQAGRAPRAQRPVPPPRTPYEDDESAFRDVPRPVPPPRQRDSPGYREAAGYEDVPDYGGVPAYEEAAGYDDGPAGGMPPEPGDRGGSGGKAKKRGKKADQRGKQRGKQRPSRPSRPTGPAKPAKQSRPAPGKSGPGAKLYFGAAAVLGLLVLLGAGAVFVLRGGNAAGPDGAAEARIGTPAGTGLSPDSYSSSASSSAYSGIASRRADPEPLTIEEVFPSSAAKLAVPDGEARLKLRAKRLDGDCAAAVWGATVGEVLGEGGCTQAARGMYSGGEDGYALAVAVFNLAGSADADRFVATLEETVGAGFVRPLEAAAPLDDFGRGFGMARGLAMGHFAVVAWAQRVDGKGDAKDETLLSLLIEGGQNPAVLGRAARAAE